MDYEKVSLEVKSEKELEKSIRIDTKSISILQISVYIPFWKCEMQESLYMYLMRMQFN